MADNENCHMAMRTKTAGKPSAGNGTGLAPMAIKSTAGQMGPQMLMCVWWCDSQCSGVPSETSAN